MHTPVALLNWHCGSALQGPLASPYISAHDATQAPVDVTRQALYWEHLLLTEAQSNWQLSKSLTTQVPVQADCFEQVVVQVVPSNLQLAFFVHTPCCVVTTALHLVSHELVTLFQTQRLGSTLQASDDGNAAAQDDTQVPAWVTEQTVLASQAAVPWIVEQDCTQVPVEADHAQLESAAHPEAVG
jgi:hypothetical protein